MALQLVRLCKEGRCKSRAQREGWKPLRRLEPELFPYLTTADRETSKERALRTVNWWARLNLTESDFRSLRSIKRDLGCSYLKLLRRALKTLVDHYRYDPFIPPDDSIRRYCLCKLMGYDGGNSQELAALIHHYSKRERGTERLVASAWGREIVASDWRIEDEEVRKQHRANYNALVLTRNLLEDAVDSALAVEIFSRVAGGHWMSHSKEPLFSHWTPDSGSISNED